MATDECSADEGTGRAFRHASDRVADRAQHNRFNPIAPTRLSGAHRTFALGPGGAPSREGLGRRSYDALALRRGWPGMLLRRSSSSARSAMRSSSVISRHTVERRDPDRRTCPAASSSRSSLRVGL